MRKGMKGYNLHACIGYADMWSQQKGSNMNRSGSQKALFVISIIEIVSGTFAFLAGIMATLAGGILGGAAGNATQELADAGVSAADAGAASAITVVLGLVLIITAIISVVEGILGIRASRDATKIMPVWILAIIALVSVIVSLIVSIVNGTFAANAGSNIASLLINGGMFWIANNIKNEAMA